MLNNQILNKKFFDYLKKNFNFINIYTSDKDIFIVVPHNHVFNFITFLKYNSFCQFKTLTDITAIDHPNRVNRFEVVYTLLSYNFNVRVNVITTIETSTFLDSVVPLYKSASWIEREVWDLYGIFFTNHNDLRRILTDYGFKGHPLRKDFPLTGFYECIYDDFFDTISYKEVSLTQEYRNFDLSSE